MKYLLDTNVVSDVSKPTANRSVRTFMQSSRADDLFVSVITLGEIRAGIVLLPEGRRRREIAQWFVQFLRDYESRVIDVDASIATIWGELVARDQNRPVPDGLIAATAIAHNLTVVTRNVRDFAWTGVQILNPWVDGVDT